MKRKSQTAAPAPAPDGTRHAGAIVFAIGRDTLSTGGFDPFWAPVAGAPVLARSVNTLERSGHVANIVLLVPPARLADASVLISAQGWRHTKARAAPGPRLGDCLRLALDAIPPAVSPIVIHDAARPLLTLGMITTALATLDAHPGTAGAAASIPVTETLKRVRNDMVVETPVRAELALLQTPQVFARAALLTALEQASRDLDYPDTASLVFAAGLPVVVFSGTPENIRLATPDDLALAEALMTRS